MSFCVKVWPNSIEFKLDSSCCWECISLVKRMSWVERFITIEVYQKSMDGIPIVGDIAILNFARDNCSRKWNSWSLLVELEIQTDALYSTGKKVIVAHHEYQQNSPCNGTCRRPSRAGPGYKQNLLSYKLLLSGTVFFIKSNVVVMTWSRRRETESHKKDVVWTR